MIYDWVTGHRKLILLVAVFFVLITFIISANSDNPLCRFILDYFDSWSQVFRTLGTLFLALIAYIGIMEERRIREEERDLNHKRRSLNEIINWAGNVREICLMPGSLREQAVVGASMAAGEWATMTAGIFGSTFKSIVAKANTDLVSCAGLAPDAEENVTSELLQKSINAVLGAAYNMKIRYKI
jgi:hypothetical protein